MRRIIIKGYGLAILLLLGLLAACTKYLDVKPSKTITTPTTLQDVGALLDYQTTLNFWSPSFGEVFTDDYFVTDAVYAGRPPREQEAYSWNLRSYEYGNDWAYSYRVIHVANLALETLSKIERDADNVQEWQRLSGRALAIRADMYLRNVWLYAQAFENSTADQDLGIVLRTTTDVNTPSKRATVRECYDKIIGDLEQAAGLLPENEAVTTRPTKYAAYGLLSRAYLSMREYEMALKYADLCLEKHEDDILDFNTDIVIKSGRALTFEPYNVEEIFTTRIGRWSFSIGSNTNARVDSMLFNSYSDQDIRKQAFFYQQPDGMRYKGAYALASGERFTGIATPEMILNRVECLVRLGDKDSGLEELNRFLLNRWATGTFTPYSADNEEEALDVVLRERRKELIFRGLRFIDIKRLNKEGRNIVVRRMVDGELISIPPNDNRYALPLPADIIAMTGMPQNP